MSRRRRRSGGASAPAAAVSTQPQRPKLSRPITIDTAQMEIPDITLLMRLQSLDPTDDAAANQMLFEAIPMIERLVVGGLSGFKLPELPAVIVEVMTQLTQAANPGN